MRAAPNVSVDRLLVSALPQLNLLDKELRWQV